MSNSFATPWTVVCQAPLSQARILECLAISFSRDWTCISCLARGFFTAEPSGKPHDIDYPRLNLGNQTFHLSRPRVLVSTSWLWVLRFPCCCCCCCEVASVVSDSVWPHRRQPTSSWDSPGKNTGVGCHFLLQCMQVKSERAVAQLYLSSSHPTDCSPPGSSVHRIFQARVLEWAAVAFSADCLSSSLFSWRTLDFSLLKCKSSVKLSSRSLPLTFSILIPGVTLNMVSERQLV